MTDFGKAFLFVAILSLIFSSCHFLKQRNDRPLAKAAGKYLYESELKIAFAGEHSAEDSIKMAQDYILQWVKEQLLVADATENLKEIPADIDRRVEEYRNSLLTHTYRLQLVSSQLDSSVSNEEIESYYQKNKANFQLRTNIIKVIYVKLSNKNKEIEKARKLIKSEDINDKKLLEAWCSVNAENYFLDENSWLIFDDLLKEIPIKTSNSEDYLKNSKYVEMKDSTMVYLLNIKGFRSKNDIAPLSMEKENIRSILINKRKVALIKKHEETLMQKGDFEIYK